MAGTFTITEDHLKLLRRMYVSWQHNCFGAPSIDCKRPYGNSYVYGDIAEILGIPMPDMESDEDFTNEQVERMDAIHKEMETVLQIGLKLLKFEVGNYRVERYVDWVKVDK